MNKSLILTAAFTAVTMLSGCAAFTGQDILTPKENVTGATAGQVKSAIIASCKERGWSCTETSKRVIHGIYSNPKFEARVDIPYSAKGFQINYVSSRGLDAKDGKIHSKYNHWVNNLRSDIEKLLIKKNGVTAVYEHPESAGE